MTSACCRPCVMTFALVLLLLSSLSLGLCQQDEGMARALSLWEKACEQRPDDTESTRNGRIIATAKQIMHDLPNTRAARWASIEAGTFMFNQSRQLRRENAPSQADTMLQDALAILKPTMGDRDLGPQATFFSATIELELGRYDEAQSHYQAARKVGIQAALGLVAVDRERGNYDACFGRLWQILKAPETKPEDLDSICISLDDVAQRSLWYDQAVAWYTQLLQRTPPPPEAILQYCRDSLVWAKRKWDNMSAADRVRAFCRLWQAGDFKAMRGYESPAVDGVQPEAVRAEQMADAAQEGVRLTGFSDCGTSFQDAATAKVSVVLKLSKEGALPFHSGLWHFSLRKIDGIWRIDGTR